eukprot:2334070-Alexandrium_andersonii.AAC.1
MALVGAAPGPRWARHMAQQGGARRLSGRPASRRLTWSWVGLSLRRTQARRQAGRQARRHARTRA